MKIYLIDPTKKWVKANLHCHTTNSDGHFSPIEVKKLYKEHGYQVVAFSDHEVLFDSSYLTDDNFVAITSSEYSLNDDQKPANFAYTSQEGSVSWRDRKVFHLNLFAKNPHNCFHIATNYERLEQKAINLYKPNIIQCDGYNRKATPEGVQETINRANKAGFLVQLNHPNWSLNTREDYINLKGLWGLEILNYGTELETGAEYSINIYDDMIRNGHRLIPTMGDDNHNRNGLLDDSFGAFNYIGVDNLTYDEVLKAMEDGNIYSSTGPIIHSLYIDTEEGKIWVECTNATDIIFVGLNRTFRNHHGDNLTRADFKIFGGEVYFRITVKDKCGKVAHTRVFYLNEYGY
ncbi:MAG: hypothetical protein WC182_00315 [Bacilli bacterium]|jgi:hypothetical protein